MSDWRDKLTGAKQEAINRERKAARERREAERAEKMRAENRMALARRLVNTPPESQSQAREPINAMARRLIQKPSSWAKPPPPTKEEIKRNASVAQKREHENALIKINRLLRHTLPFAKYKEVRRSRDRHLAAIAKIEEQLNKQKGTTMSKKGELQQVPFNPEDERDVVIIGGTEIRGHRVGKQLMFKLEDMQGPLMQWVSELPQQTENAILLKAQDARHAVNELLDGLGTDMRQFRDMTRTFVEEIRQIRMTMVTETSQMTKGLREVRQFFIGPDYKEEIARLREFVDLCERLVVLKQNGTLDAITDTMLRLAV